MIEEVYVKEEIIEFIKRIKKECKTGMDKHLCDHILWTIDDYYKIEKAFLDTSLGRTLER